MATNKALIQYLSGFATENRLNLINSVLNNRTRYITVVLEDIFQSQNASAVLRTCECMGIQDVYIIENKNRLTLNRDVVLGSVNWLSLHRYKQPNSDSTTDVNNTKQALTELKNNGYRIVATTINNSNCTTLPNFNLLKGKAALIFGTELTGISNTVTEMADEFLTIPMFGVTESLNISVSVAIIVQHLSAQLRTLSVNWQLTESEKDELKLVWLRNSVRSAKDLEKHFFNEVIIRS